MRLTTNELELLQEALASFEYEAEQALELDYNNEAVCRWARETIDMIEIISNKIEDIVEVLKDLEQNDVSADVKLTPGLSSDP